MRKTRIVDLINREIDGVATHNERLRLKGMMAADPEIAHLYADLRRMDEAFGVSAPVEPPIALKQAIMRKVERASRPTGAPSLPGTIKGVWLFLMKRQGLVFAVGMLAGILLLAGAEVVVKRSTASEGDLVGTLASPTGISSLAGMQRMELSGNGLEGTLSFSSRQTLSSVELFLRQGGSLRTLISYDPAGLAFVGIQPRDGSPATVQAEAGQIQYAASSPLRFTASFRRTTPEKQDVRIRILNGDGMVLLDRTVLISSE